MYDLFEDNDSLLSPGHILRQMLGSKMQLKLTEKLHGCTTRLTTIDGVASQRSFIPLVPGRGVVIDSVQIGMQYPFFLYFRFSDSSNLRKFCTPPGKIFGEKRVFCGLYSAVLLYSRPSEI